MQKRTIASITVGAAVLFGFLLAPLLANASGLSIESQCDEAAGSVADRTRNPAFPPVEAEQMKLGVALSACRSAYNAEGNARTIYQLARALEHSGQMLKAQKLYAEASEKGHTAAMVSLGRLLQQKGDLDAAVVLFAKASAAGDEFGRNALNSIEGSKDAVLSANFSEADRPTLR